MRIFQTKSVYDICNVMKKNYGDNRSELIRCALDDLLKQPDHKKIVVPRRSQKTESCGITLPEYYITNIQNAFPETYIVDVIQFATELFIEKVGEKDILDTYKERINI